MSTNLPSYQNLISIHALREEGDPPRLLLLRKMSLFLSTPSARRATHIVLHGVDNMTFLSTPSARRATIQFAVYFY